MFGGGAAGYPRWRGMVGRAGPPIDGREDVVVSDVAGGSTGGAKRGRPAGRFQRQPAAPSAANSEAHVHCVWCGGESPVGSSQCAGCGRALAASTAETPTQPVDAGPDIWSTYSSPGATQPEPLRAPHPTRQPAMLPPPAGPPMAPRPVEPDDEDPPSSSMVPAARDERGRPSRTPLLLGLVAGTALVVALVGLILVSRSDDGGSGIVSNTLETDPTTVPTTVPTTAAPTTAASSTTAVADSPAPTASTLPPTIASTSPPSSPPGPNPAPTEPPTATVTTADHTVPLTVAPPPTTPSTATASTPAPPPTTARTTGTAILDDRLPSGLPSADVAPALALAQQLGDALAAGDWGVARRLNPGLRSLTDAQLEDGYGGLDRAAQLLVDARRTDDADRLLVVTIANERGGGQTSLYCIESTVSAAGEVRQTSATTLDRFAGTLGIEDVISDPAITDLIRTQCTLP